MTYLKIWVHFIFATKNPPSSLASEARHRFVEFMRSMTREQKIYLDHLAVLSEHMHCLVSLGKEQTIAQVARIISERSADWINDNGYASVPLSWDDYYAVSVSESQVEDEKRYIRNQEKYHHRKTFEEELDEFFKRYGWRKPSDKAKKQKVAGSTDFSDWE